MKFSANTKFKIYLTQRQHKKCAVLFIYRFITRYYPTAAITIEGSIEKWFHGKCEVHHWFKWFLLFRTSFAIIYYDADTDITYFLPNKLPFLSPTRVFPRTKKCFFSRIFLVLFAYFLIIPFIQHCKKWRIKMSRVFLIICLLRNEY